MTERPCDPEESGLVALTVAADARYARIVRTVVAACASVEGFSVEDLRDIRLLVDTAFHALADVGAGPVQIHVRPASARLDIDMTAPRRPDRRWSDPDLAMLRTVANVLAAERTFEEADGHLVLRVVVRPVDGDGPGER